MFTGLIEDVGVVERVSETAAGRELRIRCRYQDLVAGESVAVNGACLTVREGGEGWFAVAAVTTTLERTTIGAWREGTPVNLERAMRVGDRFGGHLVQGHVDEVGEVLRVQRDGSALLVDVAAGNIVAPLLVPHGAITVEGVSLTVNAIPRPGVVQLSIIEYTERHTTLGGVGPGDRVHLEGDLVGKYIRALVAPHLVAPSLVAPPPGAGGG